MDDEIEQLVVSVRADTQGFARDVAQMRAGLEDGIGGGAEIAGRKLELALGRAIRTGKLGFDELKQVALSVMAEIARGAVQRGISSLGGQGGGGGLLGIAGGLLQGALGLPGRATGGPVGPGRAYVVGERGPEVFVPTASGRVETMRPAGGRDVRVAITINAPAGTEEQALARSGRQVARAVRAALDQAEG